jgi:heat shock protein HslJ
MRKTLLIFSFLLLASGAAFGQKRLLADTRWKLIEADRTPVTRSAASIAFNEDATRFTGNTGCNSMSGSIRVSGSRLDIGAIATTKRMCKLMEGNVGEGVYTGALERSISFRRNGSVLRFYDRRGRKTLEFTRVIGDNADEKVGLEDRKWVLEQIKGRQTFAALPYAFLNFDAKKHSAGGNGAATFSAATTRRTAVR